MDGVAIVGSCALNQWAMDFEGNLARILESLAVCHARGVRVRTGPEFEVCGFACNDHFLEPDTFWHSWEVVGEVLKVAREKYPLMLIDLGMPMLHKNVRYDCRIILLGGRIVLIRPKLYLANSGNYRESRWFSEWTRVRQLEEHHLPAFIRDITGQAAAPFGDAVIRTNDTCIGVEICEELFTPNSPHIAMALDGVEIFLNGSASHHELRKLHKRFELILGATAKSGGCYLYANQIGCDGERVYYDGSPLIAMNGTLLAQGPQFALRSEVEVVTAAIDLREIRVYRGQSQSLGYQASMAEPYPQVFVPITIGACHGVPCTPAAIPHYHTPEEEIELGPACWLWDYLRKSDAGGFFLGLSGGMDSSSCALLVYSMCRLLSLQLADRNPWIRCELQRVLGREAIPESARDLCQLVLHTAYLQTDNSSAPSRLRAQRLAEAIGSYHVTLNFEPILRTVVAAVGALTSFLPRYASHGGGRGEGLALQNLQSRLRLTLSYYLSQVLPLSRATHRPLLVVGTANCDEALCGYFTKYDNSSGDVAPIGSINKLDLRRFISHMMLSEAATLQPILAEVLKAIPAAELEPSTAEYVQTDEADIGMTYEELSYFGRLRSLLKCGPVSMYAKAASDWSAKTRNLSPGQIADKVKLFFTKYATNRHKNTILTPTYHAQAYSPDAHIFDLRPFLYRVTWPWQFSRIDRERERLDRQ